MSKITVPEDVLWLTQKLKERGHTAFCVGGCVRDSLMGVEPHDWDLTTSAIPEQIIQVLERNNIADHTVGIEFGTVTAIIHSEEYEITTYRLEANYEDGRHPSDVAWSKSIYEDLARRDFSMNAIAYDCDSDEFIDPYNGITAIENKVLVTVGSPTDRFNEDALRILRAIRFAIKYNLFISPATDVAILKKYEGLAQVSKERITEEFRKILTCGKPVFDIFTRYSDVICFIVPELSMCYKFDQNNRYHTHDVYEHILHVVDKCKTNKFEIKMAALLHDIGKPNCYSEDENGFGHFYGHPEVSGIITNSVLSSDFRVTSDERDLILKLVENHDMPLAETRKSIRRAMLKFGVDFLNDFFILKQADMDDHIYPDDKYITTTDNFKSIMQELIDEDACFSMKDLAINGNDIMKLLNIKAGKKVGEILSILLDEVVEEKLENKHKVLARRVLELA